MSKATRTTKPTPAPHAADSHDLIRVHGARVNNLKDLIISGGENIAGSEVERVLYEHDGVLEAAVVARPDDRWGEVPVAHVVRRPGTSVTAEALIEHCRGQLAKFKVPKDVTFIDALPRNPSGKVLKRELREHGSAE